MNIETLVKELVKKEISELLINGELTKMLLTMPEMSKDKAVYNFINKTGIKRSHLRSVSKLNSNEFNIVIRHLVNSGLVTAEMEKTSTKPAIIYKRV